MARVFTYTRGLHATHLIDIGVRLGLLHELDTRQSGATPPELAQALGLQPRYVQIWCKAAGVLELLDYDGARGFMLAPGVGEVLGNPDAPFDIGALPEAQIKFAHDYAGYEEFFRNGGIYPYAAHEESLFKSVAAATRALPRMFVGVVMPQLPELQERLRGRVLDVGCGAGYAMVELARVFERAKFVGIDSDVVSVRMAQDLIEQERLGERIDARVADGAQLPDDLAGQFDLVTMFLVLHEIAPRHKAGAIEQCARALKPGGTLLIFDERYPSDPTELRDPVHNFAVMAQWYELTWGNQIQSGEAIRGLLTNGGFAVQHETQLFHFYIVTANKAS
ncbi:MAG: class I SAM-dependent methyltransferase [Dehalococcoidia bacterium]|nr:class I SAM-dependent methyltransferase [Dehalococcoidia bacterium]